MSPKDLHLAPLDFLHTLRFEDLSDTVIHQAKRCLLDTVGVAIGGHALKLSGIVRDHAAEDMPGSCPMLFDSRTASQSGAAMAAGMMIDGLDGHDGWNPAKGHIGAPLLSGVMGFANDPHLSGAEFLTAWIAGYELGGRIAVVQHDTCPDYHTSGSWGAVAVAAAGAKLLGLDADTTRHALGIAEYHGPRSQMMRCIDFPTMLKDGAGWGALCGTSAVQLARRGFTGAPAITVEKAPDYFEDVGTRWIILEQYFKPYPVCRWAQAPVEGVLALRNGHGVGPNDVDHILVETFHESCRLAMACPQNPEEAQYSTAFPVAVAMVKGAITLADLEGAALKDPEVLRLSKGLKMVEHDYANDRFPTYRDARTSLVLKSGQILDGDWMNPLWAPDAPPSDHDLLTKFHDLADGPLGVARANAIADTIWELDTRPFADLAQFLFSDPKGN
ncbi:MAG: MmgE/PrpD family protein [Pseudomonadota bacterium]